MGKIGKLDDEKLSLKQKKQILLSQCDIYADNKQGQAGGQIAGMQYFPIIIEHKDLGIKISINFHRSQYKNREIALTLMELAIMDVIK